jgi:hypothetical protein
LARGYLSIPIASGWVSFFDGLLRFDAGIVEDYMAGTDDWNLRVATDQQGLGVLTKVAPIDGLVLGFGAYSISRQGGPQNSFLLYNTAQANFAAVAPSLGSIKYVYTMPDVFRVNFTFRQKNNAGGNVPVAQFWDKNLGHLGTDERSRILGDVQLLMVPNLRAIVAFNIQNLNVFPSAGILQFSETFEYRMDAITVGLNMMQWFYMAEDASGDAVDYDPSLLFNLWGQYRMGMLIPRLDLFFGVGVRSALGGNEAWRWDQRAGFNNIAAPKDGDNTNTYFAIRPRLRIQVDSRSFMDLGTQLTFDSANFDAWNKKGGFAPGDTDSRFSGVFFLDFNWTF